MNWQPSRFTGDISAVGARGIYTISPAHGYQYRLRGTGHCGLNMFTLPASGRLFESSSAARGYADRLDKAKAVEPEASGA